MQLSKDIAITVFQISKTVFEPIGDISQYTCLLWPDAFVGYASFELWAPITDDNKELIKKGNVIWCGGENAAVIESIKSVVDDKGEKTYDVKGRTLEKYLIDRIVWGSFVGSGMTSTVMYKLVDVCAVNPSNPKRKIPWLVCSSDDKVGKQIAKYQKTGGFLYDSLEALATDSDIGFSVLFDPRNKQLIFKVIAGKDLTQDNSEGNDPVVFSTELEDLLSSSYYTNNQDERTVAFVQGEDAGTSRRSIVVGNDELEGFERKELYIDARDLQSEVMNDDGTQTKLSDSEYMETLQQRGEEKLSEYVTVEIFESQIRQFGDVQYEFGVDYQKGDKVTVIDEQLGVMVSARITMAEEQFDEEYNLVLTFGYSSPTMLKKVKRAYS